MTGHGAKVIDTARFFVTWNAARLLIYCRTAVQRAPRHGFVLILERRLLAAIAPACMPKQLLWLCHKLSRLLIAGTCSTT